MLGNPYAGENEGKTFQKFLNSLLPEHFRKKLHKKELEELKRPRSKSSPGLQNTFQQMGMNLGVPLTTKKRKKSAKKQITSNNLKESKN